MLHLTPQIRRFSTLRSTRHRGRGFGWVPNILPILPALSTAPQTSSFLRFQSDTLAVFTVCDSPEESIPAARETSRVL
jgi:hypothetical protein